MGDVEDLSYLGRSCKFLLAFKPSFSFILLSPEGNRDKTRKGIKYWVKKFIINSMGNSIWGGGDSVSGRIREENTEKFVVDIIIMLKMGLKSLRIGEISKEESVVKKIEHCPEHHIVL